MTLWGLTKLRQFLTGIAILVCATPLFADDLPPLRWGADLDGGVPYVFKNAAGEDIGFEVDLIQALSKELGRKIVFTQYAFDSLIKGVERGDLDFAMNGLEITPERQQVVRFSRPYYHYKLQLVTRLGEKRFEKLEDLKGNKDIVIATLGGTAAERLLEDWDIQKRIYDEQEGPYRDLQQKGGVDGVLLDLPVALYYAKSHLPNSRKIAGLQFQGETIAPGYYGIAVHPKNEKLALELDRAIEKLIDNGELERIFTKWHLWNEDQKSLAGPIRIEGTIREMSFWYCLDQLLKGAYWTVFITLTSMALAVALGLPLATMRLYGPLPLRSFAAVYVEFFRGIPVLLLLYFLYFGLPQVFGEGFKLSPWQAAILGFGLNYAAYEAEIYRAGIGSIPIGQWEAGASLGMSPLLTFRRVILPQAIRVILPPMTNDLVALFKDTSVVSIIAVTELSKQYQILTKSGANYLTIGLLTAALYLIMSVPLGYLSRYLEMKFTR